MAEVFGIVAGAMSVSALFNNIVDTFGYVQLGRNFKRDFSLCQLQLGIVRTRLSRWGEAVKIHEDPRFLSDASGDMQAQIIFSILRSIEPLYVDIRKASKRYEEASATSRGELSLCDPATDLDRPGRKAHGFLSKIVDRRRRDKGPSLVDKTYWAVYDANNFEKLIRQLVGLVDSLEKLSATELTPAVRRELVEVEIEEMNEGNASDKDNVVASLQLLGSAASNIDESLHEVAKEKIEALSNSHNRIGTLKATETARAKAGDHWTEAAIQASAGAFGFRPTAVKNEVEHAAMSGSSRLQVGTTYGGSGFWD
ncbi:Heterokaryon incompatibility protein s [Microdochium nivale]|nr:Heterokaryon incompatibility protein s [Microdochium nivale]